jgi:hypothetical protein
VAEYGLIGLVLGGAGLAATKQAQEERLTRPA